MGQSKNKKKQKEQTSMIREILSWIIYIAAVIVLTYLVITYVGQRTEVNGESMVETLQDGDNLILNKISYRCHDPERFDIVVFPGPEENGVDPWYIKRVIGLPGETVQIKDGKVYINDEELTEDTYGITDYIDYAGIAEEKLVLADDEYFCLGDNRPVSQDCRYDFVGPVKRDELEGKIWIRIFPFKSIKK